jgi:hypothetical protein
MAEEIKDSKEYAALLGLVFFQCKMSLNKEFVSNTE